MKFYNHELNDVSNFILNELKLSGKDNRMRMKFLKLVAKKQLEFNEDHLALLKEHSHLDENGEVIYIEKDGVRVADIIDINKFQSEFLELANEQITIEENEENKDILLSVKNSLLNCDTVLSGEKAALHEYLCEKFEEIYK